MSHHNHHKPHSASIEPKRTSGGIDDRNGRSVEDRIRLRAYEISQARNGGPEDALADWVQAERELTTAHDAKR